MASKQDIIIHEKLLLARIMMEGSRNARGFYRMPIGEALNILLTKDENESVLATWIRVYVDKGNWEDDLLYVIQKILDFPTCPQRWRDNEYLPLAERLSYDDFKDWYTRANRFLDRIIMKYEPLYKVGLEYRRKQGSYSGRVEDGKDLVLNRPIY